MSRSLAIVLAAVLPTFVSVLAAGAAPVRVLVTPLEELGEGASKPWVGQAIHRSLVAELSRAGAGVEPVTTPKDATPPTDLFAAVEAGKAAGADVVVFGGYQFVDEELRVTGQTVHVADAKVIGGIKATGSLRDLFGIEDIIGAQVKRDLRTFVEGPATQPADAGTEPLADVEAAVTPTGPVSSDGPGGRFAGSDLERSLYDRIRYDPPAPPFYPYGYRPTYRYPAYDYYHPYRYRPRIIVRPGHRHDHDRGHVVRPPASQPRPLPPPGNYIGGGDGNYIRPQGSRNHVAPRGDGNSIRRDDGNQIRRNDGNQIRGNGGNQIRRSDGNSIRRSDGNSMQGGSGNSMR